MTPSALRSPSARRPVLSMIRPTRSSTLFPYTTLFRSLGSDRRDARDGAAPDAALRRRGRDRKSTRLNSSHMSNSYAVFCLKKQTRMAHALCDVHHQLTDQDKDASGRLQKTARAATGAV